MSAGTTLANRVARAHVLGLALLLATACGADEPVPPPRPNVLLVSLDTLRADHLGCYGYERDTSPSLQQLADEGVLYESAYAPSPSTVPSHATLFTGRLPTQHRTFNFKTRLPDEERTLADALGEAGYRTFAVASSARFHAGSGFSQGFEDYVLREKLPKNERSEAVTDAALERFSTTDDGRPWFGFVHYFGPHEPYAPPEPFRTRWHAGLTSPTPEATSRYLQLHRKAGQDVPAETLAYLRALYDAEILYLDSEIGRLMQGLAAAGSERDTIVIVTSDHGEEFKEHGGLSHSSSLHEELLRVPFVLRWPEGFPAGLRVKRAAELADVLPTLLEILGLPPGDVPLAGRSLLDDFPTSHPGVRSRDGAGRGAGPGGGAGRSEFDVVVGQKGPEMRAVTATLASGRYKLIVEEGQPPQLFHLDVDPFGLVDVSGERSRELDYLTQMLAGLAIHDGTAGQAAEITPEMREMLIQMGYVDEVQPGS